jgi:uncharacterized protein YecT (DUF1311 family)
MRFIRHMVPTAVYTVVFGSASAAHAEDRFGLLSSCASGRSHVEQRSCLQQKLVESRASLERTQQELIAHLRGVDQEPQAKQAALAASRSDAKAFVNYSQAHCNAFAALAYGGNSQQDRRLACQAELNSVRAQQLAGIITRAPR